MIIVENNKNYGAILLGVLILFGLWATSLYSYLLFHSIAELFSIVVAVGVFMLAWNTRQFSKNTYLLFIGIAYLFIGSLDLLHTLTYRGMGVFRGYEANLSTQLWISARYVESASLLIAPFLIGRKLKTNIVFLVYTIAIALLLGSIFYWNVFPVCFVEGEGLTTFKKVSEYVISLLLLSSGVVLFNKRDKFEHSVSQLLIASIVVTIASELAFTLYADVYGLSNLAGHYLKIVSFYLIYRAIIKTGLMRPFDLLFRDLRQSEHALRAAKDNLELQVDARTAELRRAQESLKEAQRIAGLGFLTWDAKTNEMKWSDEVYRLYGVDKNTAEVTLESTAELFHPDDVEYVQKNLDIVIEGVDEYDIDHRIVRPDGTVIWIHARAKLILDKDGNPEGLLGTVFDITKRKQAEQRLRENEERFRATFEQAAVGIAHVAHDGSFLRLNKKFCDIVGYSHDELLERTFQDITHPDDLNVDLEYMRQLLARERETYSMEKRYFRKSGETAWVNLTVSLLRKEKGEPDYFINVIEDITPRKQTEQKIREYQQRLKSLTSQLTLTEERERRRIAAELHDHVGQSLAFARIQLARASKLEAGAKLAAMLDELSESILQAARDTRLLIFDLSSPSMNEIGLTAALSEWLEEQIGKRHGLETELIDNGEEKPLDDDTRAILFRNVRELLANVVKHAKAKKVSVCLEDGDDSLSITVKDDGIGFDRSEISDTLMLKGGYGLFSIEERMADLGGSLEIVSEPGKGCTAILTAPTKNK